MFGKRKIAAVAGELLGTAVLSYAILAVSRSSIGLPYFVAIAAGLATVVMGVSVATDVHLNPALTLGLWTARRVKTAQAIVYIAAQFIGAALAYQLYKYFAHGTVQKLSQGFDSHVLVAEAVGTFVFVLVASSVLYERVWGNRRALVVGAGLVVGMLTASTASAGLINPAVALASNAWGWGTYVLGPILGAIIAVNLYALLFSGLSANAFVGAPANAAAAKSVSTSTSSSSSSKTSTAAKTATNKTSSKSKTRKAKK